MYAFEHVFLSHVLKYYNKNKKECYYNYPREVAMFCRVIIE
jgi:hypothetical protein